MKSESWCLMECRHFYCQLDYEHVPYPSPMGVKNGNIANNGCGVCCASMVVEELTGYAIPRLFAENKE